MRTLVDLMNDETAYVRIFFDSAGFGYEKSTYEPRAIGDLFDRMDGYSSIAVAREAADFQLRAFRATKPRRKYLRRKDSSTAVQLRHPIVI